MTDWRNDRIGSALRGENPTVIARLPAGFVVMGDPMAVVGQAVERACAEADPAFRRVNIEILGNTDTFLHAHVWPRYDWEPPEFVHMPVWLYPSERWSDSATALGPRHDVLRAAIARHLMSID